MQLKLPRGRVPEDSGKLIGYIKKVAEFNKCDYDVAEQFVKTRSNTASKVMTGEILSKPTKTPAAGNFTNVASHDVSKLPVVSSLEGKTEKEIVDIVSNRFNTLYTLVRAACNGAIRGLVISGAGGVGKTFAVEYILEHYKENKGLLYEKLSGVITPINIFKLLWRNRQANQIVVLDDSDSVWGDENALSLLKAALDSSLVRKISWHSEAKTLINEGIDPTFEFKGAIIFISNIDFQGIVDIGKSKLAPHLQAVLTRTVYLDLKLRAGRELAIWIKHVITKNGVLIQDGLKEHQQAEVLDFMMKHQHQLRNLSIRTAMKLGGFMKISSTDWKNLAQETEFKTGEMI